MDKEKLREIIYIALAIIVAIIAVNLFIWLLPFILIALLAYFIYSSMKKSKVEPNNKTTNSNIKKKTKKIIIIDEENNE